jgi:HEAT repeat protein
MEQNINSDISNNDSISIRASQILALGNSGDRGAISTLIEILTNQNEAELLRGCAATALGRLSGNEVIIPLNNALEDKSMIVSRSAILALRDVRSEQSLIPLTRVLENQNKKELHALTINVLSKIGGHKVTSTLLKALESENNGVKSNAALALGELRIKDAVLPLIKLLNDRDECLRGIAASSLGQIKDKVALEPLIEALNDKAEIVRTIAASSLGYLGDNRAIKPLEKVLDDEIEMVRKMAASSLDKLKNKEKPLRANAKGSAT